MVKKSDIFYCTAKVKSLLVLKHFYMQPNRSIMNASVQDRFVWPEIRRDVVPHPIYFV